MYTKGSSSEPGEYIADAKYRVVWYHSKQANTVRELRVQRPDGMLVVIICKQDGTTGLHSCEVIITYG
jgi:hypothetical protein